MQNREFKDAVFDSLARIAASFSAPKRLEIVELLAQGERSVESIARVTGLTHANASRHLGVLKQAHLVQARSAGKHVVYRIAAPSVLRGYRALMALAEDRISELQKLVWEQFGPPGELETVSLEELSARMKKGDIVLLDVRPREEFDAGHIAGAISIPVDELPDRLNELSKSKTVVAYCRGPYCVLAPDAVRLMRSRGY